jgi:hypothetical protein
MSGRKDTKPSLLGRERWIAPASAMTVALGIFGFAMLPFTRMTNSPSPGILFPWLELMTIVGGAYILFDVARGVIAGDRSPVRKLRRSYEPLPILLGCILLGLNLSAFGIVKPQLGLIENFRADPALAALDNYILGSDAWRSFAWFVHPRMAALYHEAWFAWLAVVLFTVVRRPPSDEKDYLLISYFAIWSVLGPIVHLLLPAAGPVFFQQLGLGDRFIGLHQAPESQLVARYLWSGYVDRTFNMGGGISAMPSVHVATMFWTMIALRRSRLGFLLAVALTGYIWIGSIEVGWHYFVDGVVGAIGAVICHDLAVVALPRKLAEEARIAEQSASSLDTLA